jgi:hypothetical protein
MNLKGEGFRIPADPQLIFIKKIALLKTSYVIKMYRYTLKLILNTKLGPMLQLPHSKMTPLV